MVEIRNFKQRNPLLVLAWSYGLFVLVYSTQYLYIWLVSHFTGMGFISLLRGGYVVSLTVLAKGLFALIIGVPAALLAVKYLWRRDKQWICSTFNFKLLACGIILGLLLPIIVLAILSLPGTVKIIGSPDRFTTFEIFSILVGNFGYILFIGMLMEFVFRGMVLREWASRWGWMAAAILGGLYSGAAYLSVTLPNLSFLSMVKTILLMAAASLLFAAMYIRSKSLWLPIGFHIGWNFCLKAVFGTITGGSDANLGIFETVLTGPGLLTGGKLGLEFSIVTLVVYFILAILFLKFPWKGKPVLLAAKPRNSKNVIYHEGHEGHEERKRRR